MFFTKRNLK